MQAPDAFDPALCEETLRLKRIGNRAVRRAQEESRRLGVPNVYSIGGVLHYERPDGSLTTEDPSAELPSAESSSPQPGGGARRAEGG